MVVKLQEIESPEFVDNKLRGKHKSTGQLVKLSFVRKPYNEGEDEDEGENNVFDSLVREAYPLAFRRANVSLGLLQVGEGMATIEARKRSPVHRY